MEIKAKCKYNFDCIKATTHLSLYKRKNPQKSFVVWSIISAILALIIIFKLIMFFDPIWIKLLCLEFALFLLSCYLYFILPKIRYKAMAKMKNIENEYVFCDDVVKIYSRSAEYNGEAMIEYPLFVKAYETSRYFFLFQSNNQVFAVDKSFIEGGSAEDIRNKLAARIKGKYVVCKY